jgi:hypothetical protein
MEKTSVDKKPVTWRMVTETIKLSKLQLRNVIKIGGFTTPDLDAPPEPKLLMWVLTADMLEHIYFLKPEQRTLILEESAAAQIKGLTGFAQLVFADGLYCTWTENTGFLDLDAGTTIAELPVPPMETISYNLYELNKRGLFKIENRSGLHAKRQEHAGNVEEPADVRERPANSVS